eukprot:CAMPEP_0170328892 /NCGR_PEP_ID=MMETSP0116_2-20130129/65361_1 /TAXON_ID=400756 /ORGANISM="Durinskia baltica, Strain CSIRO CS-38" /LENGTH=138 /DNA_ID=CAMNT_0010582025 /DNA_START=208 /DNA_END=620 /DNA_ORIENTATION=-
MTAELCLKDPVSAWPLVLCEISLYCQVLHVAELKTRTFADALTLTGAELASCVRMSPKCIGLVYRYAHEFLSACSEEPSHKVDYVPLTQVHLICQSLTARASNEEAELSSPQPTKERLMSLLQCIARPSGDGNIDDDL